MSGCSIHTFVSYKGGTGRTVTSLNIAYQLARAGKRTLYVDLDIDGPGGATVLGCKKVEYKQRNIVSYLNGKSDMSPFEAVVKKSFKCGDEETIDVDFLLAPMSAASEDALLTTGDSLQDKVDRLRSEVEGEYDYVIIDAASGISDYSALAFSVSDFVTVCYRWSRQHVVGTGNLFHLMGFIKSRSDTYYLKTFFGLANAVPQATTKFEYEREQMVYQALNEVIESQGGKLLDDTGRILRINEHNRQKWSEEIIQEEDGLFHEYQHYAQFLIDQSCEW